jgi:hypothetical protein
MESESKSTNYAIEDQINHYLSLGKLGHFPLFEVPWFYDITPGSNKNILTSKDARNVLLKTFSRLSYHQNVERKKAALSLLPDAERELFITSFLRLIESISLDDLELLQ